MTHFTQSIRQIFGKFVFYCNPGFIYVHKQIYWISGNPKSHVDQLQKLAGKSGGIGAQAATSNCSGEPSLQNSLEVALQTLKHMPAHATREIVVIMSSLTTCDPGDINVTLQSCKSANLRCSVISLGMYVNSKIKTSRQKPPKNT